MKQEKREYYRNINVKMPIWLIEKLDDLQISGGYGNRSDVVRDLCKRGLQNDE